jgi:hypothetical protein
MLDLYNDVVHILYDDLRMSVDKQVLENLQPDTRRQLFLEIIAHTNNTSELVRDPPHDPRN